MGVWEGGCCLCLRPFALPCRLQYCRSVLPPSPSLFFSIPLFRQPHRRASCRRCVCCCLLACLCCLLAASCCSALTLACTPTSSSRTLSLPSPLVCVCLLGVPTLRCYSLSATTNTDCYYVRHPPPPKPQRSRHRLTNFRRVASLSLLPLPTVIEGVRPGLLFRPNREIERDRKEIAEHIRHSPLVLWYG